MVDNERLLGEMQAQIASLGERITTLESELNRRSESITDWVKRVEADSQEIKENVIKLNGKLRGIETSLTSIRKLGWILVTPILAALGTGLLNLLK